MYAGFFVSDSTVWNELTMVCATVTVVHGDLTSSLSETLMSEKYFRYSYIVSDEHFHSFGSSSRDAYVRDSINV